MSVATKTYAVIAPLTYTGTGQRGFTYEHDGELAPGQVVKIPLGRRQSLGVVIELTAKPTFATKPVSAVLDITPLPLHLVQLAAWLGEYYFSSPKSVWQAILPSGIEKKRRAVKVTLGTILPKQDQPLNDEQAAAFTAITESSQTTHLVQGVTGSGKTRLYLELAARELAAGRSVIILIPEIALTPQLIAHFEAHFPGRTVPYHSGLGESARHQAWQRSLDTVDPLVVLGPRSALFLPLHSLGLIVIDECHETSYKQEQNPKYHAVAAGAKLAHLTGAKLILGSATPGLTEVYAAEAGRIQLHRLKLRANKQASPTCEIIDLRNKVVLKSSKFISEPLLAALTETLVLQRQSLLFLNRRGSASSQICGNCGHVTLCPTCHLPMTFHADAARLICHTCNFRAAPVAICPECNHSELRFIGGGTKRIEAEIGALLPGARIARLDRDSADPKTLPALYDALHNGEIDILVGTQMIAKGLDLPRLDTVGVISADSSLHMPDYSAAERTFQLIAQVAGRAGRGDRPGRVFIQTYTPDNAAIQLASREDFWTFAAAELEERKLLGYPPFRYTLKLSFSHQTLDGTIAAAEAMMAKLRTSPGVQLLGPAPAFHERAGGLFRWHIIVRSSHRSRLVEIAAGMPTDWQTDLDPVNLL